MNYNNINVKSEYNDILIELGLKKSFIKNIIKGNENINKRNIQVAMDSLCRSSESWEDFVKKAFRWSKTKEGGTFWGIVSIYQLAKTGELAIKGDNLYG